MVKTKVAFLENRLFSSQSGLFENFSDCSDWLDKSRPSKKATLNRLHKPVYMIKTTRSRWWKHKIFLVHGAG